MAKLSERNPASAPGDWYIDRRCIVCGASREAAPGLIVHRGGVHLPTDEMRARLDALVQRM